MPADPFANLPPDVRAVVDRFRAARSRVALAMVRTPLLAHEKGARKRLLDDLETVRQFVAAIDTIHAEGSTDAR